MADATTDENALTVEDWSAIAYSPHDARKLSASRSGDSQSIGATPEWWACIHLLVRVGFEDVLRSDLSLDAKAAWGRVYDELAGEIDA